VRAWAIDAPLLLAVLCAWLGCVGFVRLRGPLDRLHCVAFVNVTVGLTVTLAAFAADGVSTRSLKILLIFALTLLAGAAGTHVTGRAVLRRRET
jgi:multicomponent Na+:H+ antiporter subunit G